MDDEPTTAPAQEAPSEGEPDRDLVLSSPAQFKALGHPVRHRMVNVLRQRPATLRQLTAVLGMTKGTIGYHVRVLREAGLVRLAETRQVRGGTEQYFALVGRSFKVHEEAGVGPEFLVNAALAEMLPPAPGRQDDTLLRHFWLTPEEAAALSLRIRSYAMEVPSGDNARGDAYGLLISLYRADIPNLAAEGETEG